MAERVKLILQKRTALKSQMTTLVNILDRDAVDETVVKLRMKRLTELYHNFEEFSDELMTLDPCDAYQTEFDSIQERFYNIASRVGKLIDASEAANSSTTVNSEPSVETSNAANPNKGLIKLPEIKLPIFDGTYEKWLSFKNAFHGLIDSRTDLSEVNKLHYLKSALVGDAAHKISLLTANDTDYKKAWELLDRAYEIKRVLVSKHLAAMFNLTIIERESSKGLSNLADDMQQHIASLESLGVSVAPEIAVHLLETRLPRNILNQWEMTLNHDEYPTLESMYEFLYRCAVNISRRERIRSSNSDEPRNETPPKRKCRPNTMHAFAVNVARNCVACKGIGHPLFKCEVFKKLKVEERFNLIKEAKLCYNCMRSHKGKPCKLNGCMICGKKHNTLLHKQDESLPKTVKPAESSENTASTSNFVTDEFIKKLGLDITPVSVPIRSVDDLNTKAHGAVKLSIRSTYRDYKKVLPCLVLSNITGLIPSEVFPRERIEIPPNIKLADAEFHIPRPIDLLIRAGTTFSLFSMGQIDLSYADNEIILQKTLLGWVVAGNLSDSVTNNFTFHLSKFETLLTRFWETEEVAPIDLTPVESVKCEEHFLMNVNRDKTGKYIVRLPFREIPVDITDSRRMAIIRFNLLERKLLANETLRMEYTKVFDEYIKLGHMSLIENPEPGGFYMPHHAVFKESSHTTKLRIVFDASAKSSNGLSLNDLLLVGPTIQDPLTTHLIRFRMYNFVVTADIEKMYRQIWIDERDRKFQRVLWRVQGELKTFQLNTLTFGVSSSPYLATRTIAKLADDEQHEFPNAAKIIKSHFYVDDLLTGANSIQEARKNRDEIIAILSRGGFTIRQWASNEPQIINDLPAETIHPNFILKINPTLKTLGIAWDALNDKLFYTPHHISLNVTPTKRTILSEIAKIYDPLGLIGPIILYLKGLMQTIWRSGVHWDETLPQHVYGIWTKFVNQWQSLNQIVFNRKLIISDCKEVQLHGFCDASKIGFGACVYIRSRDEKGNFYTNLLGAKSRVAPLKVMTIPRLELNGAALLAQLYKEITKIIECHKPTTVIFWCDSSIVLHWLNTSPLKLKTYVANRVAKIQEITEGAHWRHIKTQDNPADALSRGQLPYEFMKNKTWANGPHWLNQPESLWPKPVVVPQSVPELKGEICLVNINQESDIFNKFSSYNKMLRVISYCRRFIRSNKYRGHLHPVEIDETERNIIRLLQSRTYPELMKTLKDKGNAKSSTYDKLNPFIDESGIIRVGGRIKRALLSFHQKHPILFPKHQHLISCLVRDVHIRLFHTGVQTTLYNIRHKFWITGGRDQVKRVIRKCTTCFKYNAESATYKMGNLPTPRVTLTTPFEHTGLDFCGPFYIKEKKFRNKKKLKTYVCVFVCMSIKAVHLEVVSDLTSEGFIGALRRFIARRGEPRHIYSDNGTNFVGANNQLKELYALLNTPEHRSSINNFAISYKIQWHFIPPAAPHFGGLWEATVRIFKHHLRRVVGDALFVQEELNTFVIEIEAVLNSRPILPLSSDPNDLQALSPGQYLTGKPFNTLPERDFSETPANRLVVWQHLTKVRQDFWRRWHVEYLNELQTRNKWSKNKPNIQIGALVLIKDKNLPCSQWKLGRVTEVKPGDDGVIRVVTLQTPTGPIKRGVQYVCPLPIECETTSTSKVV